MGSPSSAPASPAVRERPILFSAPMVRALLAGRKTVTRRLLKPQPAPNSPHDGGTKWVFDAHKGLHIPCGTVGHLALAEKMGLRCPFGQPGDRLWVRETVAFIGCEKGDAGAIWGPDRNLFNEDNGPDDQWMQVVYGADATYGPGQYGMAKLPGGQMFEGPWHPSIHMPRWASRLTLEVVSVRVERLHDITEEDARAEGAGEWAREALDSNHRTEQWCRWTKRLNPKATETSTLGAFAALWASINGPESWDANPWVWRVEFRRVEVAEPEGEKVEPHRCEEECCLPK